MSLADIRFSEGSYAVRSGLLGVEYLSPPTEQADAFADQPDAKTAVFPVRLIIPDIPFVVPEQELEVTVLGNLSRARTLPKDLWPIISFEIETDSSNVANFKNLGVYPSGNSAPGLLLFSRYNYFLGSGQQLTIAFPSINKEFVITFTLDQFVWQQIFYAAALARKLRFIENFFGKTFTLPRELSRTELFYVELIYRGVTEGEFSLTVPEISSVWDPPNQSALSGPPFTGPGTFSASFNSGKIELFGQQLKVGDIALELKNAWLSNQEAIEQIRQKPNRPANMTFTLLDMKATFRFEKYLQELSRNKKVITQKIENFKEGLSKKYSEPDELINSINLPLIGQAPPGSMPVPVIKQPQQTEPASNLNTSLESIVSEKILIPYQETVRSYLLQHPDLAEIVVPICKSARAFFENETELSLEIYKDPEIEDEYLTLYVRQQQNDIQTMEQLESLTSQFHQELAVVSGWLLLSIDFRTQEENRFDWREYYKLARFLHDRSESDFAKEAGERTAVSRSYFAASFQAQSRQNFNPSGRADDHRLLRSHLKTIKEVSLAARLDRLRQWKNICDYYSAVTNLSTLSGLAIDQAEKVLNLPETDKSTPESTMQKEA